MGDAVAPAPPAAVGERAGGVAAFAASAAAVGYLAVDDGAYDIVTRQGAALLVWWILGLGVAVGVLRPWRGGWTAWAPLAALTALLAWTAISLGWTESDERTVAEVGRCLGYVGVLALVLLAVRPRWSRPAIGGAVAAATAVCLLAFVNRLTGSDIAADVAQAGLGTTRLSYPLGYWNAMGTWAAMAVAALLALAVHERRGWVRGLALGAVPVVAGTAYLTYSRTSVAAVALGLLLVVTTSRRRWTALASVVVAAAGGAAIVLAIRDQPAIANGTGAAGGATVALVAVVAAAVCGGAGVLLARTPLDRLRLPRRTGRRLGAAVAVLAVVGLAAAAVVAAPHVRDQWNQQLITASGADPAARITSVSGNRRNVWTSALDAYAAHPTQGTGAGTFELWWNREALQGEFVRDAHSLYLEALAELGWPGLLLVLAFAATLLWAAIRSRMRAPAGDDAAAGARTAALAVLAVYLLAAGVDWMWESTAVTVLALVVAGASAAALRGPARAFPLGLRFAVPAVAVLACLALLPALVSTSLVRGSQRAVRDGNMAAAARDAGNAHDAAPWASTPIDQQALVAELTGRYATAQALLERAVARDPLDFRPHILLARVAAEHGDLPAARAAYRRARALRPRSALFASAAATPVRKDP